LKRLFVTSIGLVGACALCGCEAPVSTENLSAQKEQLEIKGHAAEMGQLAGSNETDMQELEPTQPEGTVGWFDADPWSEAESQEQMHEAMEDE
jgi:hypothetical protein